MGKKNLALLLSMLLCAFVPIHSYETGAASAARFVYILPDDGGKDATFVAFRARLIEAVQKRDRAFIESILHPNVLTGLGGGTGKKNFLAQYSLKPEDPFWKKLERVLAHGAQFDKEEKAFNAPALSFADSHDDLPQGIVWNKAAEIHKAPEDGSPVLQTLYAEQLTIVNPPAPEPVTKPWIKVLSREGTHGYMKSSDVYSQYDEFATFKKDHQKWCLSWFGVAGL